jgi:glycosyltransferase involved in cell wall biosynthesis
VRQDHLDLLFVPAHVLPIRPARRNVVTVHDLGFRRFPHAHRPLSRFYLELSTRWAALRATRLIAISQATAADLRNFYGVASNRIRVIYEGVDPSFRPVRDAGERLATLRTYGLGQRPFFLAVGTLQPRKNLGTLLDAFRRFLEVTECDAELVLAGRPGWDATALERRIAELDLGNRVKRLGFVADDDLPALYGAALAYVQPSLYEGFGLTVLEAMACGTPVVASNTSSLPEVVGEGGLLVDPGDPGAMADALVALAANPELRDQLAEAGRTRAVSFTWTRCARETLAVLHEAVAK